MILALALMQAAVAPDYVAIRNEVTVERPIAAVWARIGGYCAIGEWLGVACTLVSGDGGVGSVRRIGDTTLEPMVGGGQYSYTYAQTAGNLASAAYHGTLAAEPIGPRRTRLVYTLFYDAAAMPSDAVRASERARLNGRFSAALVKMKQLSEAAR